MDLPIEQILEYCDFCFKEAQGWEGEEGWDIFRVDKGEIQLMIAHNEETETVFTMFRGTDSVEDIIKDVNIFKRHLVWPYEGMEDTNIRVHSGFIEAWKTVRDDVIQFLLYKYEEFSVKSLVFIGHSLGGAIAQLASLDLQFHMNKLDYPIDISCVTFGAPRVGNAGFKESRDKRVPNTLNIVNGADPVFFQPWFVLGYRRSGAVKEVGKKPFVWLPSVIRIKSHYLNHYADNMKKLIKDVVDDISDAIEDISE